MDAEYITPRLLKIAELLYGANAKCYSKHKNNQFVFGSKDQSIKNKVSKRVAIYLVVGK